jgi:beta-glucosidase
MKKSKETFEFPEKFLWGTATAGHQVEGNNKNSDWWHWEKSHKSIENSGIATDHYNKFKADFNAHRFSIEWSRIEPREGKFDQKEIKHYKTVLEELKRLNIKTMVTLHHFVNPLWFAQKGGFEKRENIRYFERFVKLCAEHFTYLIDFWIVINEPNIYLAMSYIKKNWPPQKSNLISAFKTYLNLASTHNRAYEIIHTNISQAQVSSAVHMSAFKPSSFLDSPILAISKQIVNFSFLNLTKNHHDFLGINYYTLHTSKLSDFIRQKVGKKELKKIQSGEFNLLGWSEYPQGIYEVVVEAWRKYKLPIMITENGSADAFVEKRIIHLREHLKWLHRAIKEGVNVQGYFYWSLMDNFEWHLGRSAKFGLFEIDYNTLKRIPREHAQVYANIAKNNTLTV